MVDVVLPAAGVAEEASWFKVEVAKTVVERAMYSVELSIFGATESRQTICLFDSLVHRSRLVSRLLSISRFGFVAVLAAVEDAVAVEFTFRYLERLIGSEISEATAEDGPVDGLRRALLPSGSHALW